MRGKSNNRFKLTTNEKGWILYDVGNSAFILMVSTILPIYFNYLAENAGISSSCILGICSFYCDTDCSSVRTGAWNARRYERF